METIAFLGCSRGLGRAVALKMDQLAVCDKAILVSRNQDDLNSLKSELKVHCEVHSLDLAKEESLPDLIELLYQHQVTRLFYFAGGGPYGPFSSKQWKDHQWALQVSLLTPAALLHSCLDLKSLKQFIVVGSAIADSSPDPGASSYAAAKHGLKGLITSVIEEHTELDIRLFRPGYMDTKMLPPNAKPRGDGSPVLSVDEAAQSFSSWVQEASAAKIFVVDPL